MNKAILALGSNIGNRREFLTRALALMEDFSNIFARSKIYETPPWGVENQRDFLNAAVAIETQLAPLELLSSCKSVESKLGRVKTLENGPRQIDIDIIFYNCITYSDSTLTIPHERWQSRDFVISPLLDLLDCGVFDDSFLASNKANIVGLSRVYKPFSAF